MRILFCLSNSFMDKDICDVLKQMHIDYDTFEYFFHEGRKHDVNQDDELEEWFTNNIDPSHYDFVFSIDYCPPLATICYKSNVKYVAWSYDCPFDIKYPEETLVLPNVYCFVFDKDQQKGYNDQGLSNVYHMPLGVNPERLKRINAYKKQCEPYRAEVSFVGKLYENSFSLITNLVSDKTKEVLKTIVETQSRLRQSGMLDQLLTDSFIQLIDNEMHMHPGFTDEVTKGKVQYAIECEIARNDRILMLNLLGKRYNVNFYSNSTFELLEGVHCKQTVDYWDEMPWVFAASKINLNPILPAIHSGVNLRAFDITGCGGFMLTNRQPELSDYFIENEEVCVYDNMYDLVDKADYYLSHENERNKIVNAGRLRCFSDHNMVNRIKGILDIVI